MDIADLQFSEWPFNKRFLVLILWIAFLMWVGYEKRGCHGCYEFTESEIYESDGLPHCVECGREYQVRAYENSYQLVYMFACAGFVVCLSKEMLQGHY